MYIIMRLFSESEFSSCKFMRSGEKYFFPIKDMFQNITQIKVEEIDDAYIIYARGTLKDKLAARVLISNIDITENSINITYNFEENLDYTSEEMQKCLYALLKRKGFLKKDSYNIPLLLLLTEEDMDFINRKLISNNTTKNINNIMDLDEAFKNNNWDKVLNFFGPIEVLPHNNPEVWKNDLLISKLAFAAGKLAVLPSITKDIKNDKVKLSALLKKKKSERETAESLLKRAIELDDNNSSHYSSLGYFYYENVIELTAPNGRKDGDIVEEINKSLEAFKKALDIHDRRIKDYYRIGYLLITRLTKNLQFSSKEGISGLTSNDIDDIYLEGIEYLDKCIELYETLDKSVEKELRESQRCFKEYVKALYNRGKAYDEIFYKYWNEALSNSLINDLTSISDYKITISSKHTKYLSKAKISFEKCWETECKLGNDIVSLSIDEINKTIKDPIIDFCDKLYHIGCTYLAIYWSIKDDYNYSQSKKEFYLNSSIDILKKALKVKIGNNYNLKMKYVSEKLARAYISARKFNEAIDILKNVKIGPSDFYILNTLALAYYYIHNYNKVIEILKDKYNDKRNKVQLYSKLILLLSYYKTDNKEETVALYQDLKVNLNGRKGKIDEYVSLCLNER